ncbi:Fic/DOC family protein [Candidatus Tiddalikarchaeum anstoanum]|nr:Fic/DOC family protein [Candidatus Tiddalikarchaeum anstoanum]
MILKDNLIDISISKIKKMLITKTIKGKEYYYIKISKNNYTYLSPKQVTNEQLKTNFCHIIFKIFIDTINILYESQNNIKTKFITKKDKVILAYLLFSYQASLKKFNRNDLEKYKDAFFTKYVYGTTSIEGNTYSLRETDLTLNDGLTVSGKEKREFYEIENYSKLKEEFENKENIEISVELIKKIHKILLNNIDDNTKGNFRRIDVGIRGADFQPTPYIFIDDEINKLLKWFNKNKRKIHPVELFGIFHQKFEEIHPFIDGNGRVGRELLRIMLSNAGLPTVFIDNKNREEYLKCLDAGNKGNYKEIVRFILNNLFTVHEELIELSKKQLNINEEQLSSICNKCINKDKCNKSMKKFRTIFKTSLEN